MLIKLAKFFVNVLPGAMANSIIRSLAGMTRRPAVSSSERQAMALARRMRYGENNKNVAWGWGTGPLVIFVHGWGGRAAQMAPLAVHVASLGFRSVAIDVTGHGDTPERHTRCDFFLNEFPPLTQSLDDESYAYVCPSAAAPHMMASLAR